MADMLSKVSFHDTEGSQCLAVSHVTLEKGPNLRSLPILERPNRPTLVKEEVHFLERLASRFGVEEKDHNSHEVAKRHEDHVQLPGDFRHSCRQVESKPEVDKPVCCCGHGGAAASHVQTEYLGRIYPSYAGPGQGVESDIDVDKGDDRIRCGVVLKGEVCLLGELIPNRVTYVMSVIVPESRYKERKTNPLSS